MLTFLMPLKNGADQTALPYRSQSEVFFPVLAMRFHVAFVINIFQMSQYEHDDIFFLFKINFQ